MSAGGGRLVHPVEPHRSAVSAGDDAPPDWWTNINVGDTTVTVIFAPAVGQKRAQEIAEQMAAGVAE